MKKYALIAALLVASASSAQSIVAHVNVDSLLVQMPEYKLAQEALQAEQAKFESEAKEMNTELEKGAQALQANAATWTELRQRQEQTRLQEMYNNIQEYMQQAQGQLQQKEVELITPVLEKLQAAINAVAPSVLLKVPLPPCIFATTCTRKPLTSHCSTKPRGVHTNTSNRTEPLS